MPELPEVETIRRGLSKKIIGKKISRVLVGKKVVEGSALKFIKTLVGNSFRSIDRVGKLLIIALRKDDIFLLIHLKMTGQLIYQDKKSVVAGGHKLSRQDIEKLPGKYTRAQIHFNDGSKLFFNDLRRFGYLKLADRAGRQKAMAKFGIEPLRPDFTLTNFTAALGKRKTPIKSVLLNQQLISGIGNIYADEICFVVGVRPIREVGKLKPDETRKLWRACGAVIAKAIKAKGTTFKDYRDLDGGKGNFTDKLMVYGRIGQKCRRCGDVIGKTKIAGRTTAYCPSCQV